MGHRVAVLHDGRLQQCGPPRELYNRPANLFVAGFIGSPAMNLCRARVNGHGAAELCGVTVELQREIASAAAAGGLREVVLGLRPESLEISGSEGMNGSGGIPAEVEVVEELGADAYAFCVARPGGGETKLIARTDWRRPPAQGATVVLRPRPGEAHAFNPETGERLGA